MDVTTRHIKYQADCDPSFPAAIKKVPGCEKLDSCIQCGTCSGVCPLSIYMDMTPRRVMNLVRYGFKKEVMASNTIWLCSSCYACTVECPREIKVTDIMYALKQMAIRERAYPRRFAMVVLANEFYKRARERDPPGDAAEPAHEPTENARNGAARHRAHSARSLLATARERA